MSEHEGLLRVASTTSPPWDGRRHGADRERELRHRAGDRRRPAAPRRPRRRARPRREHLRRPLHRRHRLRRHLPPDRPAVRDRPHRPDRPAGGRRAEDPGLLGLPAPGRPGPAARRRPRRERATASPAASRCRCSTSPTRRTRCGSTASRSAAPPAPRSSTTTTRSPGSPTSRWRSLPIDSYPDPLPAATSYGASGCASTPGGADPLGPGGEVSRGDSYDAADPAHARARRPRSTRSRDGVERPSIRRLASAASSPGRLLD